MKELYFQVFEKSLIECYCLHKCIQRLFLNFYMQEKVNHLIHTGSTMELFQVHVNPLVC